MLMGADLMVPEPEFSQSALQTAEVGQVQLVELFFNKSVLKNKYTLVFNGFIGVFCGNLPLILI